MRKIIFLFLVICSFPSYSQDPSFSQSDLGSMYMNPAYTGASGHPKFLSIRREQWKNYNIPSNGELNGNPGGIRPFTTSLAEFSIGLPFSDGRVGLRTIGIGGSFMAEDHLLEEDWVANTIFLTRSDYQAYLSGLFKIGTSKPLFKIKNGKKNSVIHYIQPAFSYGQSRYGLKTDGIVTSAMLTPYTLDYSALPSPSISIQDLAINERYFHKIVIGILHSAQGNTNSSKYNRTENGIVLQRISEGFNNSPLTSKITLHTKTKGNWTKISPYWNIFSKREIYYSEAPLTNKIMAKTELGGSLELFQNTPLELGTILRFTSDYRDDNLDINWQTFSLFGRLNIRGKNHAFQLSWCTDFEHTLFTKKENYLYIRNTGFTHEFGFTIMLWGGKGPKECIEYGLMKQNGLLQDIKNNGLLNKGGFK